MCPACIASTAAMVAGAASTGGILAMCIVKFRNLFRARPSVCFGKQTAMITATSSARSRHHGYSQRVSH